MARPHLRAVRAGAAARRRVAPVRGRPLRGGCRLVGDSLVPGGRVRRWRLGQRRGDPALGGGQYPSLRLSQGPRVFGCRRPAVALRTRAFGAQSLSDGGVVSGGVPVPARLPGVRGARHGLSHRDPARPPGGPPCAPGDRLRCAHGSAAPGPCLFRSPFRRIGQLSEQQHRVHATRGQTNRPGMADVRVGHGADRVLRERGERRLVAVLRVPASAGRWDGGRRSRATAPSGNGRGTFPRGGVDPRSLRSPAESLPPPGESRRPLRGSRCPDCRSSSLAGWSLRRQPWRHAWPSGPGSRSSRSRRSWP